MLRIRRQHTVSQRVIRYALAAIGAWMLFTFGASLLRVFQVAITASIVGHPLELREAPLVLSAAVGQIWWWMGVASLAFVVCLVAYYELVIRPHGTS